MRMQNLSLIIHLRILPYQEVRYGVSQGDGENTTVWCGISLKKPWHFHLGALVDLTGVWDCGPITNEVDWGSGDHSEAAYSGE